VVVVVVNWVVGAEVVCPKCGKPGKVGRDRFTWRGRVYYYWTVRHYENGRVRRCTIQRAEGEAAQAQVAKPARAKRERAKRAARQARPRVEAPVPASAPAPAASQVDVKAIVEEAVRTAVAEALKAVNAETARILAEAVSAAVKEALAAVRAELETQRVVFQRVEDAVRQKKGEGAKAVQRGEVKVELRPNTLHWMIVEVLRGRELTKEEIAAELERRFGRRVSGNSLSGRLSELRGAGIVECRRAGKTWLWRLANDNIPAGSAQKAEKAEPETRRETRPAAQQPERQHQPAPAYVAPARASNTPAASIPAGSLQAAGLPSFAVDNPWLDILARRGETSSASTANSTSSNSGNSGLPSFAVDNPWLEVLSGKRATSGEGVASVDNSNLPSFAVDNPWLALLARR
jgi:hypothetical protein